MKARYLIITIWLCLCSIPALSQIPVRNATVVTVNSTADSFDTSPGDGACADALGRCTFRAAIGEINAVGQVGDVVIFALPNPSTIDLTLGEILVQREFAILGPGPDRLTIQRSLAAGTPDFRLMRLTGGNKGNLDIRGVTLKNGKAVDGGAIYVDQSILRMTNVVVTGNQATNGGGVYSYGGNVQIARSLFHSNTATGVGGAIILAAGPLPFYASVISNSTITNNQAQSVGAIGNSRTLSLVNNTITQNSASDVTGVSSNSGATTCVLNTIVGNNPMPQVTLSGAFTSRGSNIITDGRNSTGFQDGVSNDRVGTSNSIDPMLGPLADNGGGLLTRSLLPGSIAINAGGAMVSGNCELPGTYVFMDYDQRIRYSRVADNRIDIGAFELNASNKPWFIGIRSRLVSSGESGAFYANSPVVMTDVVTGQQRHASVNANGEFQFYDIDYTTTSVFEVRAKRRLPFAVMVFPY